MRYNTAMGQLQKQSQRVHSFDLFRMISLLGVFFYHLDVDNVPFGYLGVVGFFVLAGYLGMRNVIRLDAEQKPREPFKYLFKRFSKLYPPLLLLIFVTTLLMLAFFPVFLDHFGPQARSAVLGVNNIWQIIKGDSYFEGAGYLKPLTHLWALSLEFQFYVLFALIVRPLYRRKDKPLWIFQFLLVSALSYAALYLFFDPSGDPTRVYYGTDTRMFSFLLGALTALICEGRERPGKALHILSEAAVTLLLIASFIIYVLPLDPGFMIRYGMLAYTILYCLMMALTSHDDSLWSVVGKIPVVRYLADRSYAIYLWHFPVFRMTERFLAFSVLPIWFIRIFEISAALFISELSYMAVEEIGGFMRRAEKRRGVHAAWKTARFWIAVTAAVAVVAAPWNTLYVLSGGQRLRKIEEELKERESRLAAEKESRIAAESSRKKAEEERRTAVTTAAPTQKPVGTGPGGWKIKGRLHLPKKPVLNAEQEYAYEAVKKDIESFNNMGGDYVIDLKDYDKYRYVPISMVGDSVSVIVSYYIDPYMPGLYLDAKSNRQMWELWDHYSSIKASGVLGQVFIVALGTNGDIDTETLEKVWKDLDGRPMLLVTIVLPYAGQEAARNADIRKFAETHDQVWLVEWNKNAKGYPSFFQEDLIHPDGQGCKAFCQLITAKLMQVMKTYDESGLLDIEGDETPRSGSEEVTESTSAATSSGPHEQTASSSTTPN